eukprot:3935804-Rhodomonas_salina.1
MDALDGKQANFACECAEREPALTWSVEAGSTDRVKHGVRGSQRTARSASGRTEGDGWAGVRGQGGVSWLSFAMCCGSLISFHACHIQACPPPSPLPFSSSLATVLPPPPSSSPSSLLRASSFAEPLLPCAAARGDA